MERHKQNYQQGLDLRDVPRGRKGYHWHCLLCGNRGVDERSHGKCRLMCHLLPRANWHVSGSFPQNTVQLEARIGLIDATIEELTAFRLVLSRFEARAPQP